MPQGHRASLTAVRSEKWKVSYNGFGPVSVQSWTSGEIRYNSGEKDYDDVEWLSLRGADFLHRTVQIIVKIPDWDCGCSVPLNNIERIATKAGQLRERTLAEQVRFFSEMLLTDDARIVLGQFQASLVLFYALRRITQTLASFISPSGSRSCGCCGGLGPDC